jgi:hypothetical protein
MMLAASPALQIEKRIKESKKNQNSKVKIKYRVDSNLRMLLPAGRGLVYWGNPHFNRQGQYKNGQPSWA